MTSIAVIPVRVAVEEYVGVAGAYVKGAIFEGDSTVPGTAEIVSEIDKAVVYPSGRRRTPIEIFKHQFTLADYLHKINGGINYPAVIKSLMSVKAR